MKRVYVTIKRIVELLDHPELNVYKKAKDRRLLCLLLLPKQYSDDPRYNYLFKEQGLSESSLRMLVNGNRKSHSLYIDYLAHNEFSDDFISLLNNNMEARESLYHKLYRYIEDGGYSMDHPVFTDIELRPDVDKGRGYKTYDILVSIIRRLLGLNSVSALAYSLMIIVLCGWLQWRVEDLYWLYDNEYIDELLKNQPRVFNDSPISLLNDDHYMNDYYVYMYRNTRNELFEEGHFIIEPDYINTNNVTLSFKYKSGADNQYMSLVYKGHMVYSAKDQCMSATLNSDDGRVLQIQFQYNTFLTDMYYRQGLVIMKGIQIASPVCLRVILTKKAVDKKDMIYVKGLLNMNHEIVVLSKVMLDSFVSGISEYEWYDVFMNDIYPFICDRISNSHILNLAEVYNRFMTCISKDMLYKCILAIKSIDIDNYEHRNHYLSFVHDGYIHEIFK